VGAAFVKQTAPHRSREHQQRAREDYEQARQHHRRCHQSEPSTPTQEPTSKINTQNVTVNRATNANERIDERKHRSRSQRAQDHIKLYTKPPLPQLNHQGSPSTMGIPTRARAKNTSLVIKKTRPMKGVTYEETRHGEGARAGCSRSKGALTGPKLVNSKGAKEWRLRESSIGNWKLESLLSERSIGNTTTKLGSINTIFGTSGNFFINQQTRSHWQRARVC
jgi:hypothetical protein